MKLKYPTSTTAIRLLGFALVTYGLVLWYQGGDTVPVTWDRLITHIPLHHALVILGIFFIFLPLFPFYILRMLPGRAGKAIGTYIEKLESNTADHISGENDLVAGLQTTIDRVRSKINAALAIGVIVLCLGPFVVTEIIAFDKTGSDRARLVEMVGEARIDFARADGFRTVLDKVHASVRKLPTALTVQRLFDVLRRLFNADIKTHAAFELACDNVYTQDVKAATRAATQLIDLDKLCVSNGAKWERDEEQAALLALYALICHKQGAQGRYIVPYLQGRQLLLRALELNVERNAVSSTIHNALGVNYRCMVYAFTKYKQRFEQYPEEHIEALGEKGVLDRTTLVRKSKHHYEQAYSTGDTNAKRARYLNNSVDLILVLLAAVHLDEIVFEPTSDSDRTFIEQNLDVPHFVAETGWTPRNLPGILKRLDSQLGDAIGLASHPELFFTRGQLLSLTGEIYSKYEKMETPLGSFEDIELESIRNLRTARELNISRSAFARKTRKEMLLAWIWARPNAQEQLKDLAGVQE